MSDVEDSDLIDVIDGYFVEIGADDYFDEEQLQYARTVVMVILYSMAPDVEFGLAMADVNGSPVIAFGLPSPVDGTIVTVGFLPVVPPSEDDQEDTD